MQPSHIHTVPSLPRLVSQVIYLKDNKDLRACEQLMQHLFNTVRDDDYHIIYSMGTPIARIRVKHWMITLFKRHGVYKCLLNF